MKRIAVAAPAALLLAAVMTLALPSSLVPHEVPSRVVVRMFVKPEAGVAGDRLRLLVRVPLAAMRDIPFPEEGAAGALDVAEARPYLRDAARLWIADYVEVFEEGDAASGLEVVAARVSLPTDLSFADWDRALAHVTGPGLPAGTGVRTEEALLDILLEAPVSSADARFALEPALGHLGLTTTLSLRFLPPDGAERVYQLPGDPGLVRLDPRWHHAAASFVVLGFEHILEGIDHILFLLCLVIPLRRLRPLVLIVTSFTVAHSITLAAAVLGLAPDALWFPPLIEALIALSIVWMALENIVGAGTGRRWWLAFAFGLVHGFGFSFLLGETLQLAGSHLAVALLSFNVGVELGQLAVLAVTVPAVALLFRHVVAERPGTIILSAFIAHTGWHWMTDRGAAFMAYEVTLPAIDLFFLAAALRWAALALIVAGAAWGLRGLAGRLGEPGGEGAGAPAPAGLATGSA